MLNGDFSTQRRFPWANPAPFPILPTISTADGARESPATGRHLIRRFAWRPFSGGCATIADARRDLHSAFSEVRSCQRRYKPVVIADGTLMLSKRFFEETATDLISGRGGR